MANKTLIKVKVRDHQNVIFEGEIERISSFNEVGPFDVFPMHANFISIIRKQLTLYQNKQKVKDLTIEQAVLKVKSDMAHIFLGMEALALEEEKNINKPAKSSK